MEGANFFASAAKGAGVGDMAIGVGALEIGEEDIADGSFVDVVVGLWGGD